MIWIPQFVPELHWSQSGPRLCYQHPRRHFWLKKYQFLKPWQLPHQTRGLWKTKTDKRLIRLEWSERWNKSSTNSSFGPPGYGVRDEGTRKTQRVTTWFSEWPPSITHFSGKTDRTQEWKQQERLREINTYTNIDVGPHSWAQNRFSSKFLNFQTQCPLCHLTDLCGEAERHIKMIDCGVQLLYQSRVNV